MSEVHKELSKTRLLIRSLVYSLSLGLVLYLLLNIDNSIDFSLYFLVCFFGVMLAMMEAIFTIDLLNNHIKKKHHEHDLTSHSINHLFYPIFAFLGTAFFTSFHTNIWLNDLIVIITIVLFFLYFYLLPQHLHVGHIDHPVSSKLSIKIDFLLYFYKFYSYFVINLGLFTAYERSVLNLQTIIAINFFINALYLYFHIQRKNLLTGINFTMVILFALITTIFVELNRTSVANFSASITTITFYLASAIFYHKVDGTLSWKILAEYGAIATIVSVFLFSIQ